MSQNQGQGQLLTIAQAAKYIGFSYWQTASIVRGGEIPYIARGKGEKIRKYLHIKDVDLWIEKGKMIDNPDGLPAQPYQVQ